VLDRAQGDKPAATYWGGWEYLALGFDDGELTEHGMRTRVTRAIRELVAKGYVKRLGTPKRGERQTYEITVDY